MPSGAASAGTNPTNDEFTTITAAPQWTGKQRASLALARNLAPWFIRGIGSSLRLELPNGVPPGAFTDPPEPAIYVFWHRVLLPIAYIARGRGFGVLVSQHFDGEMISQAAARLGYRLFRGSSTRGGADALQEMTAALEAGHPIALTVDGPRGPAFVAKGGAIQLARATGAPIYALHVSPRSCWTARSWDRFQIPKPFSRARGVWTGPLFVPRDADPAQCEALRRDMQAMLNCLRLDNDTLPDILKEEPA
ncbi:MAG TPA: lysophospholipid acyltransferase family protein [Terriglobales bacterium]|nr:lysophospholipid acyltransferase family protein [Terriglobales bacterium]